jgi:hypothetical protein
VNPDNAFSSVKFELGPGKLDLRVPFLSKCAYSSQRVLTELAIETNIQGNKLHGDSLRTRKQ